MLFVIINMRPANKENDITIETKRGELSKDGITPLKFNSFLGALLHGERALPHKDFKVVPDNTEDDIKL